MLFLVVFLGGGLNYSYITSIIVVSIIELTVYTLDGLLLVLCVSKYGFACI